MSASNRYVDIKCSAHDAFLEYEDPEDLKGVIIIRKSKKNRHHNGQKYNSTHNDLQDIHTTKHKTKDRVTRTPIKTGE